MKLLIVGCPHSGTRFTATVLRSAGIVCSHEAVYTLYGYKPSSDIAVEVSWEATFHLGTSTVDSGVVIAHQTRDPIDWLNSWVRSHARPVFRAGPAWTLLEKVYPGMCARRDQDPVRTAMWLWVEMNRRCTRHTGRHHRVEDLREDRGAILLEGLGRAAGIEIDLKRVRAALSESLSKSRINHHAGSPSYRALTWKALPRGSVHDEFIQLALSYGYQNG